MAFFVAYMCHTTYLCIRFSEYSGVTIHFSGYGQSVRTFSMRQARFQRTVRQTFKHSVASQRCESRRAYPPA
nr:MAG TPA: hypothetical protein [Caudoviricetes sp.]